MFHLPPLKHQGSGRETSPNEDDFPANHCNGQFRAGQNLAIDSAVEKRVFGAPVRARRSSGTRAA
jgi:hypothetical protein